MTVLAIDLNDRALSVCARGRVLSSGPAAVATGPQSALQGARAWQRLRQDPKGVSTRHWSQLAQRSTASAGTLELITADLSARLREHPLPAAARVWMTAPAVLEPAALALVLGAVRTLAPVEGFVDAAVASAAALGIDRTALVVELGLHHVSATALDFAGEIRRRRVTSSPGGLLELYQQWLTLIAEVFVKRTRFDPLRDAAIEQRLFELLPALTAAAADCGTATAVLDAGGRRLEVPISRDQFSQSARPFYRRVLTLLHSLRPAGAPLALLMPRVLVELPGLRAMLSEFSGCELVTLDDGFAGCAVSLMDLPMGTQQGGAVPLLRRLPAQRCDPAVLGAAREIIELDTTQSEPTHVLVGSRTFVLGRHALVVGRALPDAEGVSLPEGLAGVSRRHCTFMRDRDAVVLIDHSRCGTFVNDERVTERIRVHAGDRVRIGEPGIELALIAVAAASQGSHASQAH